MCHLLSTCRKKSLLTGKVSPLVCLPSPSFRRFFLCSFHGSMNKSIHIWEINLDEWEKFHFYLLVACVNISTNNDSVIVDTNNLKSIHRRPAIALCSYVSFMFRGHKSVDTVHTKQIQSKKTETKAWKSIMRIKWADIFHVAQSIPADLFTVNFHHWKINNSVSTLNH